MKKSMYDINKIKNFDYAKKYIDNFANSENTQNKTAKELNIIGLYYKTLEEYEKSFEYFDKAIQLDKTYKAPYFNKGIIYYLKKDYKNAEKYFFKSLKIKNNDFLSLLYLGYCYKDIEKYEKAIEYLEQAISLMPKDYDMKDEVYSKTGVSYFKTGKLKEAVRNMLKGFNFSEKNLDFINYICGIYHENKQYKKAILYSKYLLNQDSDNYKYLSNYAELLYLLNKNEESKHLFKKLSERNSEDYTNYIYLARIYKEEANFELAEKYFLKTDEILQNDAQKCIEIGNFYEANNAKAKACKFYQKAIKVNPDNIDIYQKVLPFAFDNTLYTKEFEDIIDVQISKSNDNIYDFYTYKAGLLAARKLYADALHFLDLAIENSPKKLKAYQISEVLYKELNNYEKAAKMNSLINKIEQENHQ